ncbi:MAG: polyprenyl synthetase family protein [Ferruginibacter sp.]|nr:polyprenyl synthetase family protein [Ferruginibacter sp.]
MHSFKELSVIFENHFTQRQFPENPYSLYDPAQYILNIGGKRVRPVVVLMAHELFGNINDHTFNVAAAIELFHNFSLIHDDIMDKAPLRRGMETVHTKYGESTAILAGDVMLVKAYEKLSELDASVLPQILKLFNKTSREVCEGQQLDMDFESQPEVGLDDYVRMITLKTSVLLAASMQMGAILGNAGSEDQLHIYEFGKNLGIAFQIQDDYLDAYGNPDKFGKQIGGDILANKKTFLLIHALSVASERQKNELEQLVQSNSADKVQKVLNIFNQCDVASWAEKLKEKYFSDAMRHLEKIDMDSNKKAPMAELAGYLLQRDS